MSTAQIVPAHEKVTHTNVSEENSHSEGFSKDDKSSHNSPPTEAAEEFVSDETLDNLAACKAYPKAIVWSLVMTTCVVIDSYNSTSFQKRFGHFVGISKQVPSGYQLTALEASLINGGPAVGSVVGSSLNGFLVKRYGPIRVVISALIFLVGFIFITFFASGVKMLCIGEALCGITSGILSTTPSAYASEILPASLRPYLTSFTNMGYAIGQLISAGMLKGFSTRSDQWAYRIPLAVQWSCSLLIPVLLFAPQSPFHLVRHGRLDEAKKTLRQLQSRKATNIDPIRTFETIFNNNKREKEQLQVGTRYWDCILPAVERRRTEIACGSAAGQILCGICLGSNSSYFFQNIDLGTSSTYNFTIGLQAVALAGCLVNWYLMNHKFGRRTIYLSGVAGMMVVLFIIGGLSFIDRPSIGIIQAVLTFLWMFFYQVSVGPLGWVIPAEIGATRLRQKSICLARNANLLSGIGGGVLQQYLMNPEKLNMRGKTGFVWGGTCLALWLWAYFRLPETINRSNDDLDLLFHSKISARDFSKQKKGDIEMLARKLEEDKENRRSRSRISDLMDSNQAEIAQRLGLRGGEV